MSTGYWRWLVKCNQYCLADYFPWVIDDKVVGFIHQSRLPLFLAQVNVFILEQGKVLLHPQLTASKQRTEIVADVTYQWYQQGVVSAWCDEMYQVSSHIAMPPLMLLDRSMASLFGIMKYGVHMNAWVKQNNAFALSLWVAKRAKNKPTFPGCFDHLVAGGHGDGLTVSQTLIKECQEEANIPVNLAKQAKAVSLVSYVMDTKQTLCRDALFVYDLELPIDFQPENTDGEVESFQLYPVEQVMQLVAETDKFKTNCNLVLIDFFIRHGYIQADEPYYIDIMQKLRHHL